jgi:MoaA/NifB/PqqE/SkfB family radical SAM enzyme
VGKQIVMELTDRCNLSCNHCFTGRHGGSDDLPLHVIEKVLAESPDYGFDQISFTGGDPTVARVFVDAVRLASAAGFRWRMVTNGWSLPRVYPRILPYRDALDVITFSLDGATAASHDALRGRGSYRRVLQAISVCVAEGIPFMLNMVVTAHNRSEIEHLVRFGGSLGASAVRLCHLMPNRITTAQGADLSPSERRDVEREVAGIAAASPVPILWATGTHTTNLFPCTVLNDQEVNIDVRGNLTKCCHLSGHGPGTGTGDVIGNLAEMSFGEAYERLTSHNERFRAAKERHFAERASGTDYFPCWYCSLRYEKVGWLATVPDHPWGALVPPGMVGAGDGQPPAASWQPITLKAVR